MAFKIQGTTVIDRVGSNNDFQNVRSITFPDGSIQSTAGYVSTVQNASGSLVHTLNNPNAYSTGTADSFGISVAISGNYAIVGAYLEDDAGGTSSGKAYIFDVNSGALLSTLNNPNAYSTSADDRFGTSVAISGNYAIVGARQEDDAGGTSSGKAYIFNVTTGALVHTLNNPNAYSTSVGDSFGSSVAISGNYAIVGATGEDDAGGTSSGKAYIFNVTTGALLNTLNNPNAFGTGVNDFFGGSVAISGNYAIVGATGEDDPISNGSGKAYIFNVTTGALLNTLNNPNAYADGFLDAFGSSVAISGNYAIVSASDEEDESGNLSGKAYIFDVTSGALLHTLDNPNVYSTSESDFFGSSVAISGNYAIVGAYREDDVGGLNSGKAYIFDVTSGALLYTLNNPNAYSTGTDDELGLSVSISGNYAIVGAAQEDDTGGTNSGKAYIFAVNNIVNLSNVSQLKFASGATLSANSKLFETSTVGGALLQTLNNPNAYSTSADDLFGSGVAISGNYAIVGAPQEDDAGGSGSGKAYIFDVITGALLYTLNNPNAYGTSAGDAFGVRVAISGNYAIVSARLEDDAGGTSSGKTYIFNVTTGALLYTLNNPNAYGTGSSDFFGYSVAISGNYAIVSAYREDDDGGLSSGKAYIFDVTTGALLYTLNNPNAYGTGSSDFFGWSVAISGNYAIVGAYSEDDASSVSTGKAYIFNVTTGALLHTLDNPNAYSTSSNDLFGSSIAISGNYAIVGAYVEDDAGGTDSGKAYIFNVTTGALLHTLDNPNAYSTSADDYFGGSVAISGNYAIVATSGLEVPRGEDDASGTESGKAYIFSVENLTRLDKLLTLVSKE
jgi:outer membrane protein assembly factor BamB